MSRTHITEDRVISRGKGKIKYYTDDGSIASSSSKEVVVHPEGTDTVAAQEAEEAEAVAAQAYEGEQADESPDAAPASPPKRARGKSKERAVAKAAKKAAKKKAVKKTSTGTLIRMVAGREHDISGYEKVKNASGHVSYDNGDDVATKLRGKTLDEVYAFAAKQLKEPEKELRAKYKHLNVGMQRMSLGNRLRKAMGYTKSAA